MRLKASSKIALEFYCKQLNDSFTVQSSLGNTSLRYAISLLNKDELVLSGQYAYESSTKSNYLADGNNYWLISPDAFDKSGAKVRIENVDDEGYNVVNIVYGVKTVINLKQGSLKLGEETLNDPYQIN